MQIQIRNRHCSSNSEFMMDKNFDALLKGAEKAALEVFKVGENFRNKYKKTSCRTLVENILQKFRNIG